MDYTTISRMIEDLQTLLDAETLTYNQAALTLKASGDQIKAYETYIESLEKAQKELKN